MSAKDNLKQHLELILQSMEDRGFQTYMVSMSIWEIKFLLEILEEEKTPEYEKGYEYGYKKAVMDMAKKIKELGRHGGGFKEKRADGMPGV